MAKYSKKATEGRKASYWLNFLGIQFLAVGTGTGSSWSYLILDQETEAEQQVWGCSKVSGLCPVTYFLEQRFYLLKASLVYQTASPVVVTCSKIGFCHAHVGAG